MGGGEGWRCLILLRPLPFFAVASPWGGSGKGLNFNYTFPHWNCTISHCAAPGLLRGRGTLSVVTASFSVLKERFQRPSVSRSPPRSRSERRLVTTIVLAALLCLSHSSLFSLCGEASLLRSAEELNKQPPRFLHSCLSACITHSFCLLIPLFFCNSDPLMVSAKLCCRPFEHPQVVRREFLWVSPDSARRRQECRRLIRHWLFSWDKLIINSWLHPDRNPFRYYFEFY